MIPRAGGAVGRLRLLIPTLWRLGLTNVATVALYRLWLRSGLAERRLPVGSARTKPFFRPSSPTRPENVDLQAPIAVADALLEGKLHVFSHRIVSLGSPPDWFLSSLTGRPFESPERHWSRIGHFASAAGDIKGVWEASRFDWAPQLACAYCVSGDNRYLDMLNEWVGDWTVRNPVNQGPNWVCGQETSIRVLHLLLAAWIIEQHRDPEPSLIALIEDHCRRIEPTTCYAVAQNNNHATSEGASLYAAGAWLRTLRPEAGREAIEARRWRDKGVRLLEKCARRLIADDGTFSQYSVNYQRLVIDTLTVVELWRRELSLEPFSDEFYRRTHAAVEWLFQMIDHDSGDAPNIGGNDGARLLQFGPTAYRDFRPTVQLASRVFGGSDLLPSGTWDEAAAWLRVPQGPDRSHAPRRTSKVYPDGGFAIIRSGESWGVLRFPVRRFRQGSDLMHFDLWYRGVNVTRASGSFSYSAGEPWRGYFGSTEAHCTVQMDDRDQVPRVGRFLRAGNVRSDCDTTVREENGGLSWRGSYVDDRGCRHSRTIFARALTWRVTDEIAGFESRAVLRWRLVPGEWRLTGSTCTGPGVRIDVSASLPLDRCELREGWESRHYYTKSALPVLEVEVSRGPAVLETRFTLGVGQSE